MKINCKPCMDGKCDECINENCLCREEHGKRELINEFTEAMKKHLPQSPKELKQQIREHQESKKFSFVTQERDTHITKQILDHKIRILRPQTLLEDGTRKILVFLPTKKKLTKGSGEKTSTSIEWINSAYFVISHPKKTADVQREILPFDDEYLIQNFKINVLNEWNDVRWEIFDLKSWISETKSTDPTKLYKLLDSTTRKYFEFVSDPEYVKFNLWNIGTYFYELFPVFPYNDFTGTKRSGKTKCLEFQRLVCFNSIMSADITSSSTFRTIEGIGATMLFDETEEFKNRKNDQAQAVRNLLIQGFMRDQHAIRSEASKDRNFTPTQFSLYAPKSLAHINAFDDVLEERCIEQITQRSLNNDIKNSWCSDRDSAFQEIRNLCYRLFLDYADEIYDLQEEARSILSISSRELQLWTPIITLALFFEKHGVSGLVDLVKLNVLESSESRQLTDEQESRDLRVLNFIDKVGVPLAQNTEIIGKNPVGWMPVGKLYSELKIRSEEYDINPDFFTSRTLSQTMKKLGFNQKRKEQAISWYITKQTVEEVKKRMGYYDGQNDVLDSHISSGLENTTGTTETTGNTGLATNSRNKTVPPVGSVPSVVKTGHHPVPSVVLKKYKTTEHTETTGTTGKSSENNAYWECTACGTGIRTINEETESSGNIHDVHKKNGKCTVRYYTESEVKKIIENKK